MPDFSLRGRVALVTGGNSGIGRGIALAFAEHGASVAICGRDADRNAAVAAELGGDARAYVCDVSDEDQIVDLLARVRDEIGGLDVLVNNAGMANPAPVVDTVTRRWKRVLDVNLTAAMIASREFARGAERGKIINVLSEYATFGGPFLASYTASKHGLHGLTKSLAIELAPHIQVNGIQPGWIETPMTVPVREQPEMQREVLLRTPAGRWGRPEDLAGAAVFLASPASDFVTGIMLPVDGGLRIR